MRGGGAARMLRLSCVGMRAVHLHALTAQVFLTMILTMASPGHKVQLGRCQLDSKVWDGVRHAATQGNGWFKRARQSLTESVDHHVVLIAPRLKCNRAATQQTGGKRANTPSAKYKRSGTYGFTALYCTRKSSKEKPCV